MLTTIEKVIFLQNVDIFSEVQTEQLAYLAAIAEEETVMYNEDMSKENDPADCLYIILNGSVKLHRDGNEITTAKPSDAFGTWALFDEKHRVSSGNSIGRIKGAQDRPGGFLRYIIRSCTNYRRHFQNYCETSERPFRQYRDRFTEKSRKPGMILKLNIRTKLTLEYLVTDL